VREGGPVKLWERIERVLDAYDAADATCPDTFTLHAYDGGQQLRHPQMPSPPLPRPCPGRRSRGRPGRESDVPRPGHLAFIEPRP